MPEWWQLATLAAVGLLGGTFGGFLGVGGTIIFMPLLKMVCDADPRTAIDPHTAIAVTLVLNVFVGASATVGHYRAGRVVMGVVKYLVPASLAASLAGVELGNLFSGDSQVWLWRLFGLTMLYVAMLNAYRIFRPLSPVDEAAGENAPPAPRPYVAAAVGVVTGLASGLLGIGGGAIAIPAQQILLKMRLRAAIANSAVTVVFACILAAVLKHATLASHGASLVLPWVYIAALAPTAVVGALVGSHLTHRVPRGWVRGIFVAFLLWTAWEMLRS
jgi:uncharacterized membrane protein YfcA